MTKLIAVAGKGGTGKTTTAAMTVRYLVEKGKTPVFAVDADPNYTLGEALGIPVEQTIGMLREQFIGERAEIPPGMSKDAVLERQLHAAIHESKGLDLLVMGRQEGPGCYCALNNVLRNFLEMLSSDYPYVVVDNEAGMEHLSRRNTRKIDVLLIVAEHSVKAARAAGRISQLAEELGLNVGKSYIVLNKVAAEPSAEVRAEVERTGVELLVTLPKDPTLADADARGEPLVNLPPTPAYEKLAEALGRISI